MSSAPIHVSLTHREKQTAYYVAKLRNKAGVAAYANAGKYGNDMDTLLLHYRGCLGEMALAKGLNRYWSGGGLDYHNDDDVGGLQVRVTAHATGRLLIRKGEGPDAAPFFLLVGEKGEYDIVGWAYAWKVKQDIFLDAPAGRTAAYFYPQNLLNPMTNKEWTSYITKSNGG